MSSVLIRDIAEVVGGGTPRKSVQKYFGGGIPWVTPKDMKRWIIGESEVSLTLEGVENSPAKIVPPGSVLLVVRSGVLKHTLPVAVTTAPVTLNQDMKALVPSSAVDGGYLARLVKARQAEVLGWVRATTADNFPIEKLLDLRIDLPQVDEQRRIAAILDQADALRAKRRQVLAHLDALSQSIFHDMFGDTAEWPSRWCMGRIEDMAESVQYGTSAKAGETGQWPILRMGNLTDDGRIDLSDLKYIDLDASDIERYTVRRGDLLFNRTNSWEKVGKAAVVRTDAPLALAGYLVRVRVHQGHSSEFISAYLRSGHGKSTRRGLAKVAVNQANISAGELRKIPIALPPKGLQHEFARRLDELDVFRNRIQEVLGTQHILFQALQSRAFRGEL